MVDHTDPTAQVTAINNKEREDKNRIQSHGVVATLGQRIDSARANRRKRTG